MEKPKLYMAQPYYDYMEVEEYIKSLGHKFDIDEVFDAICYLHDISNRSFFILDLNDHSYKNVYLINYMNLLKKEFNLDYMNFKVEW